MIQIILTKDGKDYPCWNPFGLLETTAFRDMEQAERGLAWFRSGWPDNAYRIKESYGIYNRRDPVNLDCRVSYPRH